MAIFCLVAWTIQAADALGLIETEPSDSRSRAYLQAHRVLADLRQQLEGASCAEVQPQALTLQKGRRQWHFEAPDSDSVRMRFARQGDGYLRVEIDSKIEDQSHHLEIALRTGS